MDSAGWNIGVHPISPLFLRHIAPFAFADVAGLPNVLTL